MKVASIELFRVRLPFRIRFEHRAAARKESAGLVTRIALADGTVGWGEGVPREYVTGENVESSAQAVREFYVPLVRPWRPADFGQAAAGAAALPTLSKEGRVFNAARCSVELALFDAYGRCFREKLSAAAAYLPGPGTPAPEQISAADQGVSTAGTRAGARASGERYPPVATAVLPAGGPLKVRWLYRAFRTAGFRDFKLKVGFPDDERRFGFILAIAGRKDQKKITVRADSNGAWTSPEAEKNMTTLMRTGVLLFEQPLAKDDWEGYRRLASGIGPRAVILDESLLTIEDARRAARERWSQGFNIRISKNGGFCPSLEIARLAGAHGIRIYLGAMVGETGILAAAQRHLLAVAPLVTAVEPAFNRFLLKRDIVRKSRRGRWAIKPRSLERDCPGFGLGIEIDEKAMTRFGESIFRAAF